MATYCFLIILSCVNIKQENRSFNPHSLSKRKGECGNSDYQVKGTLIRIFKFHTIHHDDGRIELIQTGLIDRIISALNLSDKDVTIRHTSADKGPLGKDENGPRRIESWSYPSLIGMLLYLSTNSRPDIAYAVHSCARVQSLC